jgi:hypothetical protein
MEVCNVSEVGGDVCWTERLVLERSCVVVGKGCGGGCIVVSEVDDATSQGGGWADDWVAAEAMAGFFPPDAILLIGKCEETSGGCEEVGVRRGVEVELGVMEPELNIDDAEWGGMAPTRVDVVLARSEQVEKADDDHVTAALGEGVVSDVADVADMLEKLLGEWFGALSTWVVLCPAN